MNCHCDRNIEYLDPQLTKAHWWLHIFYEHGFFCWSTEGQGSSKNRETLLTDISLHGLFFMYRAFSHRKPWYLGYLQPNWASKDRYWVSQLDMIISIAVYKVRCKFSADSHTIPQEIYVGNGCAVSDICSVCSSPTWNDELSSFLGDGLLKPTNITINRW